MTETGRLSRVSTARAILAAGSVGEHNAHVDRRTFPRVGDLKCGHRDRATSGAEATASIRTPVRPAADPVEDALLRRHRCSVPKTFPDRDVVNPGESDITIGLGEVTGTIIAPIT